MTRLPEATSSSAPGDLTWPIQDLHTARGSRHDPYMTLRETGRAGATQDDPATTLGPGTTWERTGDTYRTRLRQVRTTTDIRVA